jgi:hypothetical protein
MVDDMSQATKALLVSRGRINQFADGHFRHLLDGPVFRKVT